MQRIVRLKEDYEIDNEQVETIDVEALNKLIEVGEVPVTWDNGDPVYDGDMSGTYIFTGELDLSSLPEVLNPDNLTATVNIIVKEEVHRFHQLLLKMKREMLMKTMKHRQKVTKMKKIKKG